ncbi:DUF2017 domain-containing protein [Rhodococcus antarcticus]|uniref:DUF2017 domain-containing protein n=1 Tax=Rhodococcus antarcticus TaxID=2987751 RepID=A0ABY6NWV0_9NOCA|nr:DUF2017 domain-containing protein [Rhodococcus antarcticus]UZJ23874.1 DUF2017 domain-containing protein [Rhodococcus antarcticus]
MQPWIRKASLTGSRFRSELEAQEAAVLRGMVGSITEMLGERADAAPQDELSEITGVRTGHSTPPEDATLARLLPDFHRTDLGEVDGVDPAGAGDDSAAALRSLHEPEIIESKRAAAAVLLATCPAHGGRVNLTPEEADAWLVAINDVRLSLGVVLDIDADTPDELPEDDPRAGHLGVYHWLTWVQDSLVQVLLP